MSDPKKPSGLKSHSDSPTYSDAPDKAPDSKPSEKPLKDSPLGEAFINAFLNLNRAPDNKQLKEGPSIVDLYLKNLHRLHITQPDV
jgi:hypothetical protein